MNLSFQFLDLVVVLIIVASAAYATYRGLVSESLDIFGWIAAAYATLFFGPWVAWWMQDMLSPHWLGQAAGYALVFLVVLIPMQFAASRISQNVKKTQVGTLDSVLGTAFGILRGVAIVGIAYLIFLAYAPFTRPNWLVTARLYPVIHASAEMVESLIPNQDDRLPREARHHSGGSQDPIVQKLSNDQSHDPIAEKLGESPNSATHDTPPPQKQAQPESAKPKPVKRANKAYGAKDRQALDKLIETTNSDTSGKR
jgi:membrane protein required for colicin V production